MKVVEEFCSSSGCQREGTHWHVLDVGDLRREAPGEYTITIRVRAVKRPRAKLAKRAARSPAREGG
jgi:hypothetical protein